ncbi:MAG: hypothetical protein DLM61_13095 [Pseudonocardiales bacterium]|nr:MAG: hypothetical protein DLM61_13095 [Pseudonocardiales bacterium]
MHLRPRRDHRRWWIRRLWARRRNHLGRIDAVPTPLTWDYGSPHDWLKSVALIRMVASHHRGAKVRGFKFASEVR